MQMPDYNSGVKSEKISINVVLHKSSEGGTGENRSDITPLNFWIALIYLAK